MRPIGRRVRRWQAGLLAVALAAPAAAAPPPDVVIDRLPRPTARTPAARKIAAALAEMDAQFRGEAADCRAMVEPANAGVPADQQFGVSFRVGARRLLETPALYSVEVATSRFCGTAYPDSEATAVTFDLRTGARYDLDRAFHVGNGHLAAAALPIVAKYREEMFASPKDLGGCAQLAPDDITGILRDADLSLGATRAFLIFYLGAPHVVAACFPPVQVPFAALSSLADPAELRRLGPPFAAK